MQSCDELRVVRIDLAAKKNSGDLKRAREALQSRNIDFGHSLTFAWYPKVDNYYYNDTLANLQNCPHKWGVNVTSFNVR